MANGVAYGKIIEGVTLRSFIGRISLSPKDQITPVLITTVPSFSTPVTLALSFSENEVEGSLGEVNPNFRSIRLSEVTGWRNIWLADSDNMRRRGPEYYQATHNFVFNHTGHSSPMIPDGYG